MTALASKPLCAVCGVPVESLTETHDTFLRRVTFEARCHGQREAVTLDVELVEDLRVQGFGAAFASSPRRLDPLPPE